MNTQVGTATVPIENQRPSLAPHGPHHLEILTRHYARLYPALAWQALLRDLSEQRLVSDCPRTAVREYLLSQHLESALVLVERFLADVGLLVPSQKPSPEKDQDSTGKINTEQAQPAAAVGSQQEEAPGPTPYSGKTPRVSRD